MNEHHFFALYEGRRRDPVVVGTLDPHLCALIGASKGEVWLSPETMDKQHRHHPDLTPDHYRVLPELIRRGAAFQDRPSCLVLAYDDADRFMTLFKGALKATRCGTEIYLTSFHLLSLKDWNRIDRRFTLVRAHARG